MLLVVSVEATLRESHFAGPRLFLELEEVGKQPDRRVVAMEKKLGVLGVTSVGGVFEHELGSNIVSRAQEVHATLHEEIRVTQLSSMFWGRRRETHR